MPWSIIIPIATSLIGSMASSDAADASANASRDSSRVQMDMFNRNKADLAPWKNTGSLALSQLQKFLGLGGTPGGLQAGGMPGTQGAGGGLTSQPGQSYDNIRAQLLPQFSSGGGVNMVPDGDGSVYRAEQIPGSVDEAGLQAMIQQRMQGGQGQPGQPGLSGQTGGVDSSDPNYGMLTKQFGMSDFTKDPGYQFRLDQGADMIKNQRSALGGVNSGATLRSLSDYAQGTASSEYNNAFSRWNTTLNNIFARLSGVAGTGVNAAGMTAGLGANVAGNVGANLQTAGDARGAGAIGMANALTGGMQSLFNNMQSGNVVDGGPVTTSANPGGVYTAPPY